MTIPEINQHELDIMNQVCYDTNQSVFSQTSSRVDDHPDIAEQLNLTEAATKHLCELGFVEDITGAEQHVEKLKEIEKNTGRTWRVYEITAMGRAMFQMQAAGKVPS